MIELSTAILAKHNALAQLSPKPKYREKGIDFSTHSHLSLTNSLAGSPNRSSNRTMTEGFSIQSKTFDTRADHSPSLLQKEQQLENSIKKLTYPPQKSQPANSPKKEVPVASGSSLDQQKSTAQKITSIQQIKDLISELKTNVQKINTKVEKIQDSVGLKLANIQAEVVVLSGKLNFIENNVHNFGRSPQKYMNNINQNNDKIYSH